MTESPGTSWFRLNLAALPRGVVVVDASASALPLWLGPIASVLEELAEKLPRESHPEVAFLGDRRTHPLDKILAALAPGSSFDIASQLGRFPVFGPLLWELSHERPRPLLLLANTPLLDGEDWAVPDVTARTLVYRLIGEQRISCEGFREVGPETDLSVLVEHLRNLIRSLRIGHPAALATCWDNEAFSWEACALNWRTDASLELTAAFVLPQNCTPTAEVVRADGVTHNLALEPAETPAEPLPLTLSAAEGNVLNLWRRGTPFWCSHCSRSHPPGQLACHGPETGLGLFPSLRNPAPAYRAKLHATEWSLAPLPRGLLTQADGSVIEVRRHREMLHTFEHDHWIASEREPNHFRALDDGAYLLHPIEASRG